MDSTLGPASRLSCGEDLAEMLVEDGVVTVVGHAGGLAIQPIESIFSRSDALTSQSNQFFWNSVAPYQAIFI